MTDCFVEAVTFAADKHKNQHRKDTDAIYSKFELD